MRNNSNRKNAESKEMGRRRGKQSQTTQRKQSRSKSANGTGRSNGTNGK
jgi:hypothetical protein